MGRSLLLLLVAASAACGGNEPRAEAADRAPAQARGLQTCPLVTEAEAAQAVGRPVVSIAPKNPKYPTGACKIDFGGGSWVEMSVVHLGPAVSTTEELTRRLNDDAMTGGQWKALPEFPIPAAGLEAAALVLAKKGILQLELTGFSVPYENVKALAAIAAKRLP